MTDVGGAKGYYASFDRREWERLETAQGRIEFELTTYFLAKTLPESGHVLDIGGGPGRYSRWLCEMGYLATLADLSPNLLDIARAEFDEELIREIVEADVRDLSQWPDNTFDSAIALGPFYHLTSSADRRRALDELMRVTIPGGTIAVALMSKYALLRRTLSIRDERNRMADPSFMEAVLNQGIYDNPIPGRFTEGYGVEPSNVAKSFEEAGLITAIVASTHGFATGLEEQIESLRNVDPEAYASTLEVLKATATDPSLLGTAGHLLYIGKNPSASSPLPEAATDSLLNLCAARKGPSLQK